jgi:hypothetical protein
MIVHFEKLLEVLAAQQVVVIVLIRLFSSLVVVVSHQLFCYLSSASEKIASRALLRLVVIESKPCRVEVVVRVQQCFKSG